MWDLIVSVPDHCLSFYFAWGRGSWSLCLSCICLLAMHTLICVTFLFLPVSGVGCDVCVWFFLDFSLYLFETVENLKCKVPCHFVSKPAS